MKLNSVNNSVETFEIRLLLVMGNSSTTPSPSTAVASLRLMSARLFFYPLQRQIRCVKP
ncbi:MAG: hypothetical protein ABUL66_03685 [Verrucomicrobiota bacterium]